MSVDSIDVDDVVDDDDDEVVVVVVDATQAVFNRKLLSTSRRSGS